MEKPTLAHCWLAMKERPVDAPAVRTRRFSGWVDISWSEYRQDIEKCAAGLLAIGVKKGDRVALMSNSRYEWGCADLAILSIGAITVPIYHNTTADETAFVLEDSGAAILIAESPVVLRQWRKIADRCPGVKKVICFETDDPGNPGLLTWDSLKVLGEELLASRPDAVEKAALTLTPKDVATVIYTSGTTGKPKGVVLGHEQAISEVSEAFPLCGVTPEDVSLCFLPFAHILGRVELWGHAWIGFTIAYAESIERVRQNLLDVRPTVLVSVPRIFEKVHAAIYAKMENNPVKQKLFDWAVSIGREVSEKKISRRMIELPLLLQYEAAKKLVLNKIRDAFGGRLRFAISGGAPLHRDIAVFFHAAGILILEGYGLTETTAAVTVNTPFNYKFGSVGRPIGDVKIKIAEDGEILIQSKKVMREYDRNPEATKAVFTDGWFHTGDIGEILPGGDLRITDRKKDLIKTAGGKYVAPQKLEALLKLHPVVGHVLVHGDQRKYIVALLTVDRLYVESLAKEKGIPYSHWTDVIPHAEIQALVRRAVSDANSHLASWESIKRFTVLPQEFTVEGGELTPSLKVKRKFLDQKFADKIEALYG